MGRVDPKKTRRTTRERLIAPFAAVVAVFIALSGASAASAAPPPADPFPIDEPFAGAFASPQWSLPVGVEPNTATLVPDGLRLTDATTNFANGNATLAQSFSSDVAFTASFDYRAFGGGFAGDAFTFFLMDGSYAPNLGIDGGAAGYAGMQGAYLAVGFDNTGNFATDGRAPFDTAAPNSIALRGAYDAADGAGGSAGWPVLARTPATIQTDETTPRHVTVTVEPSGADSILLTVVVDGTTVFDAVDVRTVAPSGPGDVVREQPARPATFALGFSGATGGATNTYIVSDFAATAAADLAATKTGPATVEPGTQATWTITAADDDTNPVAGATISDSGLPSGMTDVAWTCTAVDGSCAAPSGTGTGPWTVDLARGGTATVTVTGTVPDSAAGTTITNTATVTAPADRTETALDDNTATSTTSVLAFPDLSTTAVVDSVPLEFGASASWTVTVANVGEGAAPGSAVAITLPDVVDPDTVVPPPGCTASGLTLTCDLGELAPGATVVLPVSADATGSATSCASGAAVLSATASGDRRELVADNDAASVSASCVVPVDVSVTKTSNGRVDAGSPIVWTITAANAATNPAPATRITDALPTGAAWTCTVSDGSACAQPSGRGPVDVTADLPAGGTATVVARVVATDPGTVSNTASIAPCPACVDASADDDTATATATVAKADLATTGGSAQPWLFAVGGALIVAGAMTFALRTRRR